MPHFLDNQIVLIYFLISIILLMLSIVSIFYHSNKLDNINFIFTSIVMVCFYGLRYPGTTDAKMYLANFDGLSNFASFQWGGGFYALMKSISFIDKSHDSYIFFSSAFFVILLAIFAFTVFRNSYYKSLFMIVCYLNWDIFELVANAYRQGIAVVLSSLACILLYRKRFILSLSLYALAITFHWGVFIVIVASVGGIFIMRKKILLPLTKITLLLFGIVIFIKIDIMSIVYNYASALSFLFSNVDLSSKADAYLAGGVTGANFYEFELVRRIYNIGTMIMPLLFLTAYLNNKERGNIFFADKQNVLIATQFILLIFYGVFLISMTWFMRNFYWNSIFSCAIFIIIIQSLQKSQSKYFNKILAIFSIYILLFSLLTFWRTPSIFLSYP